MKLINLLLTIVFILFASFQYNDADTLTWALLYSFVAVMSALAIFKRYSLPLLLAGISVFAIYFIYLTPSILAWIQSGDDLMDQMSTNKPYIEESREGLGLLLGLITLVFHLMVRNRYARLRKVG
jgi:hypothetical protein